MSKANVVADALSRYPVGLPEETDPSENLLCALIGHYHPPEEVALLQQGDASLKKIIMNLPDSPKNPNFVLHKHCLYRKNTESGLKDLLVVPSFLRRDVLHARHDHPTGGHMGIAKTLAKVSQRYWWPGMTRSVRSYVLSCAHCQINKPMSGQPIGKLMPIPPPREPFETVGVDHLGPFKITARGNKYVLVVIDYLTKWLIAIPVPDVTTASTIRALREFVLPQHGVMCRRITDQGSAFTAKDFALELRSLGVPLVLATTERPQPLRHDSSHRGIRQLSTE